MGKTRYGAALLVAAVAVIAAVGLVAGCTGDDPVVTSPGIGPDAQADAGTDGTTGGPTDAGTDAADAADAAKPRHCELTTAPPNTTDFLCADFDDGTLGAGTSTVVDDGGALHLVQNAAFSAPNALGATALTETSGGAALVWAPASGANFLEATAKVQVNPAMTVGVLAPNAGAVDLITIKTSTTRVTFSRTRGGGTVEDPSNYYGFLVTLQGSTSSTKHSVATPLVDNAWTDVTLSYSATDGRVKVLYNLAVIYDATVASLAVNDTSVTFRLGAVSTFTNSVPEEFRFDDAELSIRR
jgi:hypothetical protein